MGERWQDGCRWDGKPGRWWRSCGRLPVVGAGGAGPMWRVGANRAHHGDVVVVEGGGTLVAGGRRQRLVRRQGGREDARRGARRGSGVSGRRWSGREDAGGRTNGPDGVTSAFVVGPLDASRERGPAALRTGLGSGPVLRAGGARPALGGRRDGRRRRRWSVTRRRGERRGRRRRRRVGWNGWSAERGGRRRWRVGRAGRRAERWRSCRWCVGRGGRWAE